MKPIKKVKLIQNLYLLFPVRMQKKVAHDFRYDPRICMFACFNPAGHRHVVCASKKELPKVYVCIDRL